MSSIFVSIASCKELFLVQTIKSAMANASRPDLVYFGVCNMVIDKEDFLDDPVFKLPNINIVETKHSGPLGTGIGRMLASLMADKDHEYFLQVDAHTIFVKGWDDILKKQYKELLLVCEKPIISASPRNWEHSVENKIMISGNQNILSLENLDVYYENPSLIFSNNKNAVSSGMNFEDDDYETIGFVEGCDAFWSDDETFKEHGLIHAAFVFFSFSFLNELVSDPFDPWSGDQTNISFRAGTRGYRMFTVRHATVFTKDKFDKTGSLLYDYDWRRSNFSPVHDYQSKKAHIRLANILSGKYIGFWGAPDKESIDKYQSFFGFKFSDNFLGFKK
jgi:hypothetical protein